MIGRDRNILIAAVAGATLLVAFPAQAAELVLHKVPVLTVEQAPRYPQNLVRADLGAKIELGGREQADEMKLPSGVSTVVVSLGKIEQIESIAFSNDGATGKVMVATSSALLPADSPQWHTLPTQSLAANATSAKVGAAEAKYVRLIFVLDRPSKISELGVYGPNAVADFTMPRSRESETSEAQSNVADLHSKARVIYASSGDDLSAAQNLIDDQADTSFAFSAGDTAPAVIVDLGHSVALRRVSLLTQGAGPEADVYVFDTLPNQNADILRLSDANFARWKPVATGHDDGSGRLIADFPEKSGRYLMVRWKSSGEGLRVAEISAFGQLHDRTLVAANARAAVADGKTMRGDAKDFTKDAKDFPAEEPPAPGEGPGPELPQPPPFVFTPEVLPTSP